MPTVAGSVTRRRSRISPDGRNVYVVAAATQALAVFTRDAGVLTQLGCVTLWANGNPRCATVPRGLSAPVAVTVSADGRNVSAVS